jgi:hypothetical protein
MLLLLNLTQVQHTVVYSLPMLLCKHYKYPVDGHNEHNNTEGFSCITKVACCVSVYIRNSNNICYTKSFYIGVESCEVNARNRNTG